MSKGTKMPHVLIVDDDRTTVRLLTLLLEMDGYQVSQSPNPEIALKMGRMKRVDAFVVDCHLVGYDGLDMLRAIRGDADLADKLVIMTSGRDLARESKAAGADLFLLKPFSPSELSNRLSELLQSAA